MKKQILTLILGTAVFVTSPVFAIDEAERDLKRPAHHAYALEASIPPEAENRLILQPTYRSCHELLNEFLEKQKIEFLKINQILDLIAAIPAFSPLPHSVPIVQADLQENPKTVNRICPLPGNQKETTKEFAKRFCSQVEKFKGDYLRETFVESSFNRIPSWDHYEVANFALHCFALDPQLQYPIVIDLFAEAKDREDFLNFLTHYPINFAVSLNWSSS